MKFALEQNKTKLLYKNHLFSIFIKAGLRTFSNGTLRSILITMQLVKITVSFKTRGLKCYTDNPTFVMFLSASVHCS